MSEPLENPAGPKAQGKPPARGFLNPHLVKSISFTVISLCLLFCTVISVLAVWDFIARDDLVWRSFSTLLIMGIAAWVFNVINKRFGD